MNLLNWFVNGLTQKLYDKQVLIAHEMIDVKIQNKSSCVQ